jgi:hypothetical protein
VEGKSAIRIHHSANRNGPSQDRDLETRTGTVTRTVPTLSESFRQIVIGLVDLILYCDVQIEQAEDGTRKHRRVVRTKPSPNYDAGDRFGCLPEVMDLNFQAFVKAFEPPKQNTTPASAGAAKTTR